MAKEKRIRTRIVYRSKKTRHRTQHEIGLVPAIFGGMAAAVPFVANDEWGSNFIGNVQAYMNGDQSVAQYMGGDLLNAAQQNLPQIITLGALAAIFGYVGKKVKIPVSKHLKVF